MLSSLETRGGRRHLSNAIVIPLILALAFYLFSYSTTISSPNPQMGIKLLLKSYSTPRDPMVQEMLLKRALEGKGLTSVRLLRRWLWLQLISDNLEEVIPKLKEISRSRPELYRELLRDPLMDLLLLYYSEAVIDNPSLSSYISLAVKQNTPSELIRRLVESRQLLTKGNPEKSLELLSEIPDQILDKYRESFPELYVAIMSTKLLAEVELGRFSEDIHPLWELTINDLGKGLRNSDYKASQLYLLYLRDLIYLKRLEGEDSLSYLSQLKPVLKEVIKGLSTKTLEISPTTLKHLIITLSTYCYQDGYYSEAEQLISLILKLSPEDKQLKWLSGIYRYEALLQEGNSSGAEKVLEELEREIPPVKPVMIKQLALRYYKLSGAKSLSWKRLEKILKSLKLGIGYEVKLNRSATKKALKYFKELLRIYPDRWSLAERTGDLLIQLALTSSSLHKRTELLTEALTYYQLALRHTSKLSLKYKTAILALYLGEKGKARALLRDIVSLSPKKRSLRELRMRALMILKRIDENFKLTPKRR